MSRTRGIPTFDECANHHRYLANLTIPDQSPPAPPLVWEKHYVEGFLFSPCRTLVTLVRKSSDCKITVLRDRWVGVGGAIEAGEKPNQAMERECLEETGVQIPASSWDSFSTLETNGISILCFRAFSDRWADARTVEHKGEEIRSIPVAQLSRLALGPSVALLMALALEDGLAPVTLRRAA